MLENLGIKTGIGTGGKSDTGSLTLNKTIDKLTGKAVSQVDKKVIKSSKVTDAFARTIMSKDIKNRIMANYEEMEANGYKMSFVDRAQNVWKSSIRESSGVVWK